MIEDKVSIAFIFSKRWHYCCLLVFLLGCNSNSNKFDKLVVSKQDSINNAALVSRAFILIGSAKKIIQSGDLITRTGNDFTSESLRSLNQHDKTYSHCGIASIEHDTVFVYHALGGEFNPDQKLRKDPIDLFCEPGGNRGFGIFRYQLNQADCSQLILNIKKQFAAGVMFDMKFDLTTDDRMYCAEFVYKSFSSASNKLHFSTSQIKNFVFVGVDDLFLNPVCKEITRVRYK